MDSEVYAEAAALRAQLRQAQEKIRRLEADLTVVYRALAVLCENQYSNFDRVLDAESTPEAP